RTVREIVVDQLEESGDLELSGVADLVRALYWGNFLERQYLDVDKAVERAINPVSRSKEMRRQFVRTLRVDWNGADRFVRFLHDRLLRWILTPFALMLMAIVSVGGFITFLSV